MSRDRAGEQSRLSEVQMMVMQSTHERGAEDRSFQLYWLVRRQR